MSESVFSVLIRPVSAALFRLRRWVGNMEEEMFYLFAFGNVFIFLLFGGDVGVGGLSPLNASSQAVNERRLWCKTEWMWISKTEVRTDVMAEMKRDELLKKEKKTNTFFVSFCIIGWMKSSGFEGVCVWLCMMMPIQTPGGPEGPDCKLEI